MAADPDCIFCKIVAGKIPCLKVLQDEHALAFLDIGPLAEGHTLLIPTGHYVTLDQMPADEAAALLRHLPALGRAVQQATGAEGYNVLQNNGRVAHQVVQHVHFHVIPKHADGTGLGVGWRAGTLDQAKAPALAAQIRDAMH